MALAAHPLSPPPSSDAPDLARRLAACAVLFLLALSAVFLRMVYLEVSGGDAFREAAGRPLTQSVVVGGVRGRILSSDGAVLAFDRRTPSLAVHYRWLEEPSNRAWLRRAARATLTPAQRRDPAAIAQAQEQILAQRKRVAAELATRCGLESGQWERRTRQIQARVERIAQAVAQRRGAVTPIAEQRQFHLVADDVPLELVAEIQRRPELYPGVKIVDQFRRSYPGGSLAAHVLGHLGPATASESAAVSAAEGEPPRSGQAGLERQYESLLAGQPGRAMELSDHTGRLLSRYYQQEPGAGRDLVLTLDARIQAAAESLLDQALARRDLLQTVKGPPCGGAVVVLEVHRGAVLALAAAPRFDPNWFATPGHPRAAALLADPARPLFDRASAMALPPGSVFKIVTATALLHHHGFDPRAEFPCAGYLNQPEHWRCAEFVRHSRGHGPVDLPQALAESCNVFFFHHAQQMGLEPILDWARRFGFGKPVGLDLPTQGAGTLPRPEEYSAAQRRVETLSASIGQGSLTATPLQIARVVAAIANGGKLVTPHLVRGLGMTASKPPTSPSADDTDTPAADPIRIPSPQPISDLQPSHLAVLAEGLRQAVDDRRGTAHATLQLDNVAIAAKTGTAQTEAGRPDHAWLAAYFPADRPRLAVVVVLEHAGDAATAACPLARRLIQKILPL